MLIKNEKDGSGTPGHTPGLGLSKLNIHFYILTPVLTNFEDQYIET